MNKEVNYDILSRNELIHLCIEKDNMIDKCIQSLQNSQSTMLGKKEIMRMYKCESDKALKILKLMFQMGYGNKIGKEYYISNQSQENFINNMAGKEVFI